MTVLSSRRGREGRRKLSLPAPGWLLARMSSIVSLPVQFEQKISQ